MKKALPAFVLALCLVLSGCIVVKDVNNDGTVRILTYGDSNTYTWNRPYDELWPSQAQVMIDDAGLGWDIVIGAWPGRYASDTQTLTAWLAMTDANFIDLVSIALCTNDFSWGNTTSAAEVRDRLAALVTLAKNAIPSREAIVATCPQLYVYGEEPDPRIDELNAMIMSDHARFPHVVDFHTIVSYPADYSDFAHLNAEGLRKRALSFFNYIRPYSPPSSTTTTTVP